MDQPREEIVWDLLQEVDQLISTQIKRMQDKGFDRIAVIGALITNTAWLVQKVAIFGHDILPQRSVDIYLEKIIEVARDMTEQAKKEMEDESKVDNGGDVQSSVSPATGSKPE